MSTSSRHDAELIAALRAGDETAFVDLVHAHHSMLLRVAMTYVPSRAIAEEVVASDVARSRAVRESRRLPLASLSGTDIDRSEPSVDPDRFLPPDHAPRGAGPARPLPGRPPTNASFRARPVPSSSQRSNSSRPRSGS